MSRHIDRLSREEAMRLAPKGRGLHTIHVADNAQHEVMEHAVV
jgi:hypothetical protein